MDPTAHILPAEPTPAAIPDAAGLEVKAVPAGLRFAILLVALAGLFAAAVLSVGHVLDLPVPCGGSRGCATVAAHPSSKLFGVPIAFLGMAAYVTHLVLMGRPVIGRRARLAAVVLAAIGTIISAGLLVYSQTVIRATCPWCVASGIAMAGLLVLGIFLTRPAAPIRGPRSGVVWTLGLLTAAAIGVQAGRMERAASAPPVSAERLAKLSVSELDDAVKSIGPADAPVMIVIFADFWCPACRAALTSLLQYQKAHAAGVRVVYRHQPLWQIRGHETSKAAAALSEMAGEQGKFWAFADAVHTERRQLTRERYLELMHDLGADPAAVEARLNDPTDRAIRNVQRDIELAERLGIHATPTFLLKVGTHAPISASQRGLPRLLNSPAVTSLLVERRGKR